MTSSGICPQRKKESGNDGTQIKKNGGNAWMRHRSRFHERSCDGGQHGKYVRNVFEADVHESSKEKDGEQIDDATPDGQENVHEAGKGEHVIDEQQVTLFRRQRFHDATMIFGSAARQLVP